MIPPAAAQVGSSREGLRKATLLLFGEDSLETDRRQDGKGEKKCVFLPELRT